MVVHKEMQPLSSWQIFCPAGEIDAGQINNNKSFIKAYNSRFAEFVRTITTNYHDATGNGVFQQTFFIVEYGNHHCSNDMLPLWYGPDGNAFQSYYDADSYCKSASSSSGSVTSIIILGHSSSSSRTQRYGAGFNHTSLRRGCS